MLNMEVNLKWYHNSIIENHDKSVYHFNLSNGILFYPATFLNNQISKALGEKEKVEVKVRFNEFE